MSHADLLHKCVIDKTGRSLSDVFCREAVTRVFSSPVCVCVFVCVGLSGVRLQRGTRPPVIGSRAKRDLTRGFD